MQLNPNAAANAVAIAGGAFYILCAVWTVVSRSSYMLVMSTWTHGINLSLLPEQNLSMAMFLTGFVTFVATSWVTGFVTVYLYNNFAQKR